jgi:NAD(P)-dependent dehydrogenase (short-subunit alcohol dehydrogenase family)
MVNSALEGLVRVLALELAPVRVNAISPRWMDTPIWDAVATPATPVATWDRIAAPGRRTRAPATMPATGRKSQPKRIIHVGVTPGISRTTTWYTTIVAPMAVPISSADASPRPPTL